MSHHFYGSHSNLDAQPAHVRYNILISNCDILLDRKNPNGTIEYRCKYRIEFFSFENRPSHLPIVEIYDTMDGQDLVQDARKKLVITQHTLSTARKQCYGQICIPTGNSDFRTS
jgi:hypothetical protein